MSLLGMKLEHNLPDAARQTHLRIAKGARNAVERMSVRAKLRLRQNVLAGGLGPRVANAWRADIYPRSASVHTHSPAVQVFTKAPLIVAAFSAETIVLPTRGVFLAIPTGNVPNVGTGSRHARNRSRSGRAGPEEVESIFNQDLIFRPGRNGTLLAFVNAVRAKSGKGSRRATRRRTRDGRQNELVLMFVMVRQAHLRKRLDTARIFDDLAREWPDLFAEEMARALAAGTN